MNNIYLDNSSTKDNNLLIKNPKLASQWHKVKNKGLSPNDFTTGSNKKVWWICENGHEWLASISSRNRGKGCPGCSGRVATKENNLLIKNPKLASQWNEFKNKGLLPQDVTPASRKVVWWQCENGHEWQESVMTRNKRNCPMCSGRRPSKENNLKTRYPSVAKDWHPTRNGTLRPEDTLPNQTYKVWWQCENGHEVEESLATRTRSKGCKLCKAMMFASFPEKALAFYIEKLMPVQCQKYFTNTKHVVDLFLQKFNVVIEYDGYYYHKTKVKTDQQKTLDLIKLNTQVIRIREGKLPPIKGAINLFGNENELNEIISKVLVYLTHTFDLPLPSFTVDTEEDCFAIHERYTHLFLEDSLIKTHFKLVNEWHPTKNMPLTPDKVKASMSLKVWWQCKHEHVWEARISSRVNGSNCPKCAGNLPTEENNLALLYPVLAREWHPTINGSLTPKDILPFSTKKVWWLCKKGHPFQSRVYSRTAGGTGCSICSGYKITESNSLASRYPNIAKYWHPTKNDHLSAKEVSYNSKKKIWWCCEEKHLYLMEVKSKVAGAKCPYCSGRLASEKNNLMINHPKIAREWNYEKNGMLTPDMITSGSQKMIWWKCEKEHVWTATVYNRTKHNTGCPFCRNKKVSKDNNLLVQNPILANQWHPTKNGSLSPEKVLPNSHKRAWWVCSCGHEWEAIIKNRNRGNNCPQCAVKKRIEGRKINKNSKQLFLP